MSLKSNNWCNSCQSSECPCVSDDEDEILDYFSFVMQQEEQKEEQDPQELEKATWIAENQQLNNEIRH